MLCYVMCTCVNDRVYSRLHGPYTAVDTARVYIAHTRPCSRHVHVHYCLHGRLHTRPVYRAVYVCDSCTRPVRGRVHGRLYVYTARTQPWTRPVYTAVFKSYHIAASFLNVKITFFSLFTSRDVPQGMCSRFSSVHHVHYSPEHSPLFPFTTTFTQMTVNSSFRFTTQL